jgi:hypothetical protein
MPVINGKVTRSRYTKLTLNELSSVDNPAQPGALAMIMKRADPVDQPAGSGLARAIAKYVSADSGAHSFQEVLAENKFSEAIWPFTDALSQSIRSIMGDGDLTAVERDRKITATVDEFLTAVRRLDPPETGDETESEKVEKQLRELISKKDDPMTTKSLETLQAEIDALKGQLATVTAERDTQKAAAEQAATDLAAEKTAHETTKASLVEATDEAITVAGKEFKKSVVGEASFSVAKAAADERDQANFEKRAATEFGHVAGTATEKALVLKHAASADEATQKAITAILESAEKLAKGGFSTLGTTGELSPTVKAARAGFMEKVAEIEKRDSCNRMTAMNKAEIEHPDLFEAYREAGDEG